MRGLNDFKGVMPAMLSVFDGNEDVYEKGLIELTEHLISQGVEAFYLTGSTGEGFLMSLEERKQTVEIILKQVKNRIPVMVHVGAIGTRNSIQLAQHAYNCGADAISSVPPFYWRFNEEQIHSYYKDIAESTPLPMVVYNVPLAGTMGIDALCKLSQIPKVKGVKYTATTHFEIPIIKNRCGEDFKVYSGCDEMALSGLMNGADGIIGSFYNLMPELFIHIYEAVKQGDSSLAIRLQQQAIFIIKEALKYDLMSVMRLGLKWIGIDAGYSRRPFKRYSTGEEVNIKKDFMELKARHDITGVHFLDVL